VYTNNPFIIIIIFFSYRHQLKKEEKITKVMRIAYTVACLKTITNYYFFFLNIMLVKMIERKKNTTRLMRDINNIMFFSIMFLY
jgi:hypothetical protein